MYLAISCRNQRADLIARVPHLVKICSADHIEHLVQRALPGVLLAHVVNCPPGAIPVKLNYQYFSLTQSGGPWEASCGRGISPSTFPAISRIRSMELIILLPQAAQ